MLSQFQVPRVYQSQIFINDQFNFLDHMDTSSESDSEQWEVRHFRSSSVEEFDELR